jgi:hypothetical protein
MTGKNTFAGNYMAIKALCGRSRTTAGQNHTGDRRNRGKRVEVDIMYKVLSGASLQSAKLAQKGEAPERTY